MKMMMMMMIGLVLVLVLRLNECFELFTLGLRGRVSGVGVVVLVVAVPRIL